MSRFVTASDMAKRKFGPLQFYRLASELFARKTHLSWEDWDEFFALAHECGMTSGEETNQGAWSAIYPEITRSLTRSWRRVKEAKESGIDAFTFHCNEKARFKAENDAVNAMQAQYAQERKDMQNAAKSSTKNRNAVEY